MRKTLAKLWDWAGRAAPGMTVVVALFVCLWSIISPSGTVFTAFWAFMTAFWAFVAHLEGRQIERFDPRYEELGRHLIDTTSKHIIVDMPDGTTHTFHKNIEERQHDAH